MGHIHTNPGEHDATASLWIVRTDTHVDEPAIMLHLHKKLGRFMQFGGHIELDESPWSALAHECVEEAGYEMDQLQVVQPVHRMPYLSDAKTGLQTHPLPFYDGTHDFFDVGLNHLHDDRGWMFVASEPPRQQVAEGESDDIRNLSARELAQLSDEEIYWNVREIGQYCLSVVSQLETAPHFELIPASEFATKPFRSFDD